MLLLLVKPAVRAVAEVAVVVGSSSGMRALSSYIANKKVSGGRISSLPVYRPHSSSCGVLTPISVSAGIDVGVYRARIL